MTLAFVISIHIIFTAICSGAGGAPGERDSKRRVSGASQPKYLDRKAQKASIRKTTVEGYLDESENRHSIAIEDSYGSLNRLFDIVPPTELREVLPKKIVVCTCFNRSLRRPVKK